MAVIYLAEGASWISSNVLGPVLGALGVIATAVFTTITTLRTSQRATALQQQQQLEARSDKQYERLQKQLDETESELDKARDVADALRRERDEALDNLARLRHRVWAAGHDPETIGREPGTNDPRPRI